LPFAGTSIGASSPWIRPAATTCARIIVSYGASVVLQAPTQIGQRRDSEINTFAGEDPVLPMGWQMLAGL
jgi:hypothetical protein